MYLQYILQLMVKESQKQQITLRWWRKRKRNVFTIQNNIIHSQCIYNTIYSWWRRSYWSNRQHGSCGRRGREMYLQYKIIQYIHNVFTIHIDILYWQCIYNTIYSWWRRSHWSNRQHGGCGGRRGEGFLPR